MTEKKSRLNPLLKISVSLLIITVVMFENSYILGFTPIVFLFTTVICLILNRFIKVFTDKESVVLVLFCLYAFLLTDYSTGTWSGMGLKQMPTTLLICLFVYYSVFSLPKDKITRDLLIKTFVLSALGLCVIITVLLRFNIFNLFQESSISTLRNYGYNRNSVGERICLSALLLLCLSDNRERYKVIFWVLCIISVLTGSRTVILAYLGYLMGYWFGMLKQKRHFIIVAFTLIFATLLLFEIPVVYSIIGHRFFSAFQSIQQMINGETITETRLRMILIGWDYFKESPIIGNGWASFAQRYSVINEQAAVFSHCNYIELLCNAGIIGFIIYYLRFLFVLLMIYPHKGEKQYSKYMGLVWALLLMDISSITYYYKFYYIYYALILIMIKHNVRETLHTA